MKKLTSLVLVFLTSMFSLTSWATERVAPTMPTPCVPDSGQIYFLYNVESGLFISDYDETGETPLPLTIHLEGDDVRLSYTSGATVFLCQKVIDFVMEGENDD